MQNTLKPRRRYLGLGCLHWVLIGAGLLVALFACNTINRFGAAGPEPTFTPTKTPMPTAPAAAPSDTAIPAPATNTPPPPSPEGAQAPVAAPVMPEGGGSAIVEPTPAPIVLEPTAAPPTETRSDALMPEGGGFAIPLGPTINSDIANLRSGPGTAYPTVGTLSQGQAVELVARNEAGDWVQLTAPDGNPAWLAAFLVDNVPGDLPIISAPAIELAAPAPVDAAPVPVVAVPVEVPTAIPEPARLEEVVVPVAAVCDCSGDTRNCSGDTGFNFHSEAQACFDYCRQQVGTDIHGLDGADGDLLACESLP